MNLQSRTILVNGNTRTYQIHLPAAYSTSGAKRWPVIFAFHGAGGTGQGMSREWEMFADKYVLVFPDAFAWRDLDGAGSTRRWISIGDEETREDIYFDEAFVQALVAEMRERKTDPAQLYACGFSSGGKMTQHLAVRCGDLFAGFGVTGKSSSPLLIALDSVPVPRPMMAIVGDQDDAWLGSPSSVSAAESRDYWAAKLGADLVKFTEKPVSRAGATTTIIRDYGNTPARFVWARVESGTKGAGHRWYKIASGDDIETAEQFVAFWQRHAGLSLPM